MLDLRKYINGVEFEIEDARKLRKEMKRIDVEITKLRHRESVVSRLLCRYNTARK